MSPLTLVPMKFPWTRLPVVPLPLISTPLFASPEMTLRGRRRPADRVLARAAVDQDAVVRIAHRLTVTVERRGAGLVGTDEVSCHEIAGGAHAVNRHAV